MLIEKLLRNNLIMETMLDKTITENVYLIEKFWTGNSKMYINHSGELGVG